MAGSKNLFMRAWTNLPFRDIERFIASLRRTSFDGDVCVFVDAVAPATVKALIAMLRGKLDIVRAFYRRLLAEFVGREQGLRVPKIVRGAINKLSYDSALGYPVIIHPNAAEVYFEISPQSLGIDSHLGVRVVGTVPAIVVKRFQPTSLMATLRASLRL